MPDAVLTGVETRTSSPLRITRGKDTQSVSADGGGGGSAGGGMAGAAGNFGNTVAQGAGNAGNMMGPAMTAGIQ